MSEALPPKTSRLRSWAVQAALLLLVVYGIHRWQTRHHLRADAGPAPDIQLVALDGTETRLSAFRGRAVLLHFWATWCTVCRVEFGALKSLNASLDDNSALVTVVADSDVNALKAFRAEHELDYPIYTASPAALAAFGVQAFPTNYFIAPNGHIDQSQVGWSSRFLMRARLGCMRSD